jgi:hypothetical protein
MSVSRHFVPFHPFKLLPWPLQLGVHRWAGCRRGNARKQGGSPTPHTSSEIVKLKVVIKIGKRAKQAQFDHYISLITVNRQPIDKPIFV